MELKLTRRNSLLIIVIIALVPIIYFSFTSNYISNQVKRLFTKETPVVQSNKVVPMPSNNRTFSVDNKWSWSLFEGVIKSYGRTINGIDYVEVGYFLNSEEEYTVKIMLQTELANLPKQVEDLKKAKSTGYNDYRDALVEKVSYFEKYSDISDFTSVTKRTLEDFKVIFPVDTSLVFRILDSHPQYYDLDSDYCKLTMGLYNCVVLDLNNKYAPDLLNLWKGEKLSENSIIVPNNIFISLEDLAK